jgi:GH43 family beta-xylosidase
MADGKFGVVARYSKGAGADQSAGRLLFWTTDNLVDYNYHGLVQLTANQVISNPQVTYDSSVGRYYITWMSGTQVRECYTTDWISFSAAADSTRGRVYVGQNVSGGSVTCGFTITKEEAEYLRKKLDEVKNVSVEPFEEVKVPAGKTLGLSKLPKTLTAVYSDTSTGEVPIVWNPESIAAVNMSVPGEYTVTGQASVKDYGFPTQSARPDPMILKYNGRYYFISTNESGQSTIYIRSSETLDGLRTAPETLILSHNAQLWAPELHIIGGKLCILLARAPQSGWNRVQCNIMTLTGTDPMIPSHWSAPVPILKSDGTQLTSDSNGVRRGISLDMTYLEENGVCYYVWAGRYTDLDAGSTGDSYLAIAKFDPADPTILTSDPVMILRPDFAWEQSDTQVDEGPFFLRHDGRLFMTYSGNGVNNTYAVGLMEAIPGSDLTDPANWSKVGYTILSSYHVPGQDGPGHNAYTQDEFGRDVLVFHARLNGGTRSAGYRTMHYGFDGAPILYMTPDRYLLPEYRAVSLKITVTEAVTDVELGSDSKTVTAILANGDSAAKTMRVIVAAYSADNKLTEWVVSPEVNVPGKGFVSGVNVSLTGDTTDKTIKAYVWDDKYVPQAGAWLLKTIKQ